jgi:hypothetical protein
MSVTPKWAEAARRRDLLIVRTLLEKPEWLLEKVVPRIEIDAGCHIWTGTISDGYGLVALPKSIATTAAGNSAMVRVHRLAKIIEIDGPIDFGMTLDHLCRNRQCCNAEHLDVVTQGENLVAPGSLHNEREKSKTACPRGHDLTDPENWAAASAAKGRRNCLTCQRETNALRSAAAKALGITRNEYYASLDASRAAAERILESIASGIRPQELIDRKEREEQ